jgi:hypothetical protein
MSGRRRNAVTPPESTSQHADDPLNVLITARINYYMEQLRLTKADLARETGIKVSNMGRLVRGLQDWRPFQIRLVAQVLGVSPRDLVDDAPPGALQATGEEVPLLLHTRRRDFGSAMQILSRIAGAADAAESKKRTNGE